MEDGGNERERVGIVGKKGERVGESREERRESGGEWGNVGLIVPPLVSDTSSMP